MRYASPITAAVLATLYASPVLAVGPSSSAGSYLVPVMPGVQGYAIFSAGDSVNNKSVANGDPVSLAGQPYRMVGTPDGLGSYDNGDGTFTLLVNHEIAGNVGAVRAHGAAGAFVSKWVIANPKNAAGTLDTSSNNALRVLNGSDLIRTANTVVPASNAFTRFCSGDLAPVSAYQFGNSGTSSRIYMNGEESGSEGRAMAHVATGPNAGQSYELPRLGKFSWENSVANPVAQQKTIVFGTDDATAGGNVYLYVGNKTATGSEVDRAGLTNGNLYGVKISGVNVEDRTNGIGATTGTFSMVNRGDVTHTTGIALDTTSNTVVNGVAPETAFLRPEDAAWDPVHPTDLYFATTDRYDGVKDGGDAAGQGAQIGRSRLWRMRFSDVANPEAGGQIELLIDGSENVGGSANMMDNLTVIPGVDGITRVMLVEDVGGNNHNGKILMYNTATDALDIVAKHDPSRFGDIGDTDLAGELTRDEEFSGITDARDTLGLGWFLLDDQAHYGFGDTEIVEGGQLIALYVPQAIPEPTSLGLLGLAGAALLKRRRR